MLVLFVLLGVQFVFDQLLLTVLLQSDGELSVGLSELHKGGVSLLLF